MYIYSTFPKYIIYMYVCVLFTCTHSKKYLSLEGKQKSGYVSMHMWVCEYVWGRLEKKDRKEGGRRKRKKGKIIVLEGPIVVSKLYLNSHHPCMELQPYSFHQLIGHWN